MNDFPILQRKINGHRLVYLDNAATTQKPRAVINAIVDYYERYNANVHRGVYTIADEATRAYEDAHRKVAAFINATSMEEIVFTKNTTEGLNLLAATILLRRGDEIVLSEMEHHSNIVPWQRAAKRAGARLRYIPVTKDGELDMERARKIINKKTAVLSVTHVSNVLGTINDVKALCALARKHSALSIVDAAQSVPHMPVDVQQIGCDFLVFSGHKMCGPMGIGVLYGRKELLEALPPFLSGGDMIREVSFESATWNDLPWKFEAGTPNVAGAVGLATAIDYLQKKDMRKIFRHEQELTSYAMTQLRKIPGITLYGPKKRAGVISFTLAGAHPHDISALLDTYGVAIRGGHHCAMPLAKKLGIDASARVSFYLYNTKKDVDTFIAALKKTREVLL